jgi:hypothetical protein
MLAAVLLSEGNENDSVEESLRLVGTRVAGDPLNLGGRFISHPTLHQKRSYPIFETLQAEKRFDPKNL